MQKLRRNPAARCALCSLASWLGAACAGQPAMGSTRVARDQVLLFEQRRAAASADSADPDWESWQLYESGRFVHARAGAEPTQQRIDATRLAAVHAWLSQHDFELVRNSRAQAPPRVPGVSASCQLHLSTGLTLAPLGDPRYYACDALKHLAQAPQSSTEP